MPATRRRSLHKFLQKTASPGSSPKASHVLSPGGSHLLPQYKRGSAEGKGGARFSGAARNKDIC